MQLELWMYFILMVLSGAWTGYITNDVAIKMLFKEYGIGKLKFGGVIVKTRKDLEKNLAKLVEQEIINHSTLKSQFHKSELKEIISKTVVSFFNESIYNQSKDIILREMPGFQITFDQIQTFLRTYLNNHLTEIFIQTSEYINLDDIISKEQAHTISQSLSKELLKLIKNERAIVSLIKELYVNYNDVTIENVVGNDILDVVVHNLNELLTTIFDELRFKHDKDVSTLIGKLYRDIDVDRFIETLESYIGEKKINYFINEETLTKLYDLFRNYLKEPSSKESIQIFCEGLLIALRKVDKPIIELFSGDFRIEIEKFLETQLPSIIDRLIEIVQQNSHEIEELIESSIDQTIYDQLAIKRIILGAIRMFLIENFTQKYDIINKIVELLKGIDIEDMSKTISVQVVDILSQKSVSSIIIELETNNILTARLISSQVHRILSFLLERYLSSDIEHTEFLNKPLKQLMRVNLKAFMNTMTVTVLTKQIIYNKDIVKFIKQKVTSALRSIAKLPINHFVSEDKMTLYAGNIQQTMGLQLEKYQSELSNYIFQNLNQYLEGNSLKSVINPETMSIQNEVIVDVIINSIEKLVDDHDDIRIHDIFHKINSMDNLGENVVNVIMEFLNNGLNQILEGNISRVVEDNIKSQSNDEVLDMMQEFMGSKLKPLTILGAFLGAFVGLGLAIFNPRQEETFTLYNLLINGRFLISIPIYAALGYFTNVVAIYFIFKPYKPLFGIKRLQGIIPKQIPLLAKAMGQVVSNNLLSEDSIDLMVHDNESKLKNGINDSIKKDQYKILRTYLSEYSTPIVTSVNDTSLNYMKQNSSVLGTKFAVEVMKMDLNKIKTEVFIDIIARLVKDKADQSSESISQFFMNKFKSSKSIRELSDELNVNMIEEKIDSLIKNELGRAVKFFEDPLFIGQIIKNNEQRFNQFLTRPMVEIIPEKTKVSIEDFLYQLVSNYLYSREKQRSLSNYVITEITTILNNNDSIDEMFGGRFIELINFNMTSILEKIEDAVNKWLNAYKEDINESVTRNVFAELSVMQQVGYKAINGDKLIKDTVFRIVDDQLPKFVGRKIDSLNLEFNHFFDNLGKIKLKDAKVELRKEELNNYLVSVFESKEIEIKTRRFITGVMDHFLNFDTGLFFDLIDIKQTDDVINRFNDIFVLVNKEVYVSLTERQDMIIYDISLIINKFVTNEILSNRVRNLMLGITEEQMQTFVRNLITMLNKDDFMYHYSYNIIGIVFNHIKNVPVDTILDGHYLKQDLKRFFSKMAIDSDIYKVTYQTLKGLFSITIDEFDKTVADELKDYILNDIINAAYEAINNNLKDILHAVDFEEVTMREINQMEPKQIKDLFDSFGSKYFRKLELYGLYGGIFAVEVISFATFMMHMGYTIKGKNNKKKL